MKIYHENSDRITERLAIFHLWEGGCNNFERISELTVIRLVHSRVSVSECVSVSVCQYVI